VHFTFQTEPEEAVRGHVAVGDIVSRGHKMVTAISTPIILAMWATMFAMPAVWIRVTLIVFVTVVLVFFALWIEARRRLRRLVLSEPGLKAFVQLDIRDDGLTIASEHVRSEFAWEAIRRVVETPEFYLFFGGLAAAQHLPKRVLASQDPHGGVERELRELIRRRSPDRGANLLPDPA
jgi:hypothetical protein